MTQEQNNTDLDQLKATIAAMRDWGIQVEGRLASQMIVNDVLFNLLNKHLGITESQIEEEVILVSKEVENSIKAHEESIASEAVKEAEEAIEKVNS